MKLDHFVPILNAEGEMILDRLQSMVLQSIVNAMTSNETVIEVNPFVISSGSSEQFNFDPFVFAPPFSRTSFNIPYLSDVFKSIENKGESEWVVFGHPDVIIKPNFYSVIEHYLVSGHDAILVSTSNVIAKDLPLIRRSELFWCTNGVSGYTPEIDYFVFSRKILKDFNFDNALAVLPHASSAIYANLLKLSKRIKYLYEDSVTCRFNNIKFWSDNLRYNKLILDNFKSAKEIFNSCSYSEEQRITEHYRRLSLKLDNNVKQKINKLSNPHYSEIAIKKYPKKLSGSTWAISTYFNPTESSKILDNYIKFSSGLKKQNVPLLTVELSFKKAKFDLNNSNSDILVQIDDGDVLWQKERMFNLSLKYLPEDCDKVVYMDGDIYFSDPSWMKKTELLLEDYCFVQPFSHVVRLNENAEISPLDSYEVGWEDGQAIHSFAWGLEKFGARALKKYPHHGTVGIALAARRDIMQEHGWFDCDIVGSGDLLTVDSIMLQENFRADLMNEKFKTVFEKWQKSFRNEVKNSLSYTPGVVYHMWHGSSRNRFYQERHRILEEYDFDPQLDIYHSEKGVWKWKSEKLELHKAVKKYFNHRDDE